MAFLDCFLWYVFADDLVETDHYLVYNVVKYNSNTDEFNTKINPICTCIPDFEIMNKHLLDGLDYNIVNEYKIPILMKIEEADHDVWTIDLRYYDEQVNLLQSNSN